MGKQNLYLYKTELIFIRKSFRSLRLFGRSILRLSSGVPCLSGHRNDSTWKIIFKVWRLIKQYVQELWRSFVNNDVIVFHAFPRSITRSFTRWSFTSFTDKNQLEFSNYCLHLRGYSFYLTFLIIGSHFVFISILGLLSRSLQPKICADSLRRLILQCLALSIISTSSHKGRWFPFFPSI